MFAIILVAIIGGVCSVTIPDAKHYESCKGEFVQSNPLIGGGDFYKINGKEMLGRCDESKSEAVYVYNH